MKKIVFSFALALSAITLTGCSTPIKLAKIKPVAADVQAKELTIYREPVLINSRAAKAIVSLNNQEIVELKNAQYTKVLLAPSEYNLYVRSDGSDKPNEMKLSLNKNTCLKISPNASNIAKALLFSPAFLMSSTFSIQEDVCLNAETIGKYTEVPFIYDQHDHQPAAK